MILFQPIDFLESFEWKPYENSKRVSDVWESQVFEPMNWIPLQGTWERKHIKSTTTLMTRTPIQQICEDFQKRYYTLSWL